MKFTAIIATAAVLVSSGTALAWEHVLNDYGNGQVMNAATSFDEMGDASLMLGCLMGQGALHLQVVTGAPGVAQAPSEVVITASGVTFPIPVLLGETEGFLLATASSDTAPILPVAQAIYAASGQVEIVVEGQAYFFAGGDFNDAVGAMLEGCG